MKSATLEQSESLDTRIFQREFGTIFITVDARFAGSHLSSRLPLIRAHEFETEFLATTESISLRQSENESRSHSVVALERVVGLDRDIVGLVEHTVENHVERVALSRRVARSERERRHREQSKTVEHRRRLVEVALSEHVSTPECHVLAYCPGTHRTSLAAMYDGDVASHDGVGELL